MTLASPADVAVPLLRDLTQAEHAYAIRLLKWAEILIQARHPDLSALNTEAVILVESQAVARVLRNPDGKYQESVDDYSSMRDRVGADGLLRITDEEWALLSPSQASSGGAFSVDTVATCAAHAGACALYYGGAFCSCGADVAGFLYGDAWCPPSL